MKEISLEHSDEATLKEARADGVVCSGCDRPHDKIMQQVEFGAVVCDMEALGHIWYCKRCAPRRELH